MDHGSPEHQVAEINASPDISRPHHAMRLHHNKHGATHLPDTGIIPVPYGLKDAGEMSPDEATRFADDLAEELK